LRWAPLVALVLVVAVAGGAALSWHFSSRVLVPDHSPWSEDVEIAALAPGEIVLERDEATERPGYYGLVWHGGHAVVGPVLKKATDSVTRRLSAVRGYLAPGMDVGLDTNVFTGDPREARGLSYRSESVVGELGPMPAWLIPAPKADRSRAATWAIVVHGINSDPQVGLRVAPALRRAGLTSLLITYRDDLGAPSSPDGLHHQGQTEWRDLAAAVRFALDRGARRVVLVGYSMGGALISQFMQHSPQAGRVAGLVLDAPALDWEEILRFNATEMGLPASAALPVQWAIDARIDVDWDSLDAARHPDAFQVPILLFHGTDDSLVPIESSEGFAQALPPHRVSYFAVPGAGHTQAWNVDPRLYERRLRLFLDEVLKER
jgi:uncharacterized protein